MLQFKLDKRVSTARMSFWSQAMPCASSAVFATLACFLYVLRSLGVARSRYVRKIVHLFDPFRAGGRKTSGMVIEIAVACAMKRIPCGRVSCPLCSGVLPGGIAQDLRLSRELGASRENACPYWRPVILNAVNSAAKQDTRLSRLKWAVSVVRAV